MCDLRCDYGCAYWHSMRGLLVGLMWTLSVSFGEQKQNAPMEEKQKKETTSNESREPHHMSTYGIYNPMCYQLNQGFG